MHFCAIHLDDASWPPEEEQVYVVVPGGGAKKTAIAVPLDALPQFLPLLEQAAEVRRMRREHPEASCVPGSTLRPGRSWVSHRTRSHDAAVGPDTEAIT